MLFGGIVVLCCVVGIRSSSYVGGCPQSLASYCVFGCVFCIPRRFTTGCICIYAAFGTLLHEAYKVLLPMLAPMPEWFPLCCYSHPRKQFKVRSIWGLRFTPSENAYYTGSPCCSDVAPLGSYPGTPTGAPAAPLAAPACGCSVAM